MSKLLLTFCIAFSLLAFNNIVNAQSNQTISIMEIKSIEKKVEITLSSDQSFYIGGNRYVLHIGEKYFMKNKHPNGNVKLLTFILTTEEYDKLDNESDIVLVYGFHESNIGRTTDIKGKHWKIGKLNKEMLNK